MHKRTVISLHRAAELAQEREKACQDCWSPCQNDTTQRDVTFPDKVQKNREE